MRIKPIIATNDCTFEPTEKNKIFERLFSLRHEQKVRMIKDLTAEDCVEISPNENSRYEDGEVYIFIRDYELPAYGEFECVTLYIKMYLHEEKTYDLVVVISFHPEGMYND